MGKSHFRCSKPQSALLLAVGLQNLTVQGLHQIDCSNTACRALSQRDRIKIKTACIQHAEVTEGTLIDKDLGSGYTAKSTCPSGFNPIGIRRLESTGFNDVVRQWCLESY